MRNLIITIAILSACLSGCATSASSTWNCADGTCLPKYAMANSYEKPAISAKAQNTDLVQPVIKIAAVLVK